MAKLIELVRKITEIETFTSKYKFIDYEDFKEKQENPVLQYLGFNKLDNLDIKGVALEKLDTSLREFGIITSSWERRMIPLYLAFFTKETFNELRRGMGKKMYEKTFAKLQNQINIYETFKDNINRAKLEIVEVPEARDIIDSVKKIRGVSPYVELNYGRINEDLREAYSASDT